MLTREDFIFTIGYDGPVAVVDKQAKGKFGRFSTKELAEKGLFRAAYSSAVYSGSEDELKLVVDRYNALVSTRPVEASAFNRLFGVAMVDVKRSISL